MTILWIAIFTVALLLNNECESSSETIFRKTWPSEQFFNKDNVFLFKLEVVDNSTFSYALCGPANTSGKNCTVINERYDGHNYECTKKCNVLFTNATNKSKELQMLAGSGKWMVFSTTKELTSSGSNKDPASLFFLLDMEDCELKTAQFDFSVFYAENQKIELSENGAFDVIAKSRGKALCQTDYCRLRFNSEGKYVLVDKLTFPNLVNMNFTIHPIKQHQQATHFIVATYLNESSLNYDSVIYLTWKLQLFKLYRLDDVRTPHAIDASEGYASICFLDSSRKVICKQFLPSNQPIFSVPLNLLVIGGVETIKVKNSPNGGLAVLLSSCKGKDCQQYFLINLGPRGEVISNVIVDQLECTDNAVVAKSFGISIADNKQVCASAVCKTNKTGSWEYKRKCYTMNAKN